MYIYIIYTCIVAVSVNPASVTQKPATWSPPPWRMRRSSRCGPRFHHEDSSHKWHKPFKICAKNIMKHFTPFLFWYKMGW